MIIKSEDEMIELGRKFGREAKLPVVFELVGDVGAGKTTFTRGLAEGLGADEAVTSPSFTISKRYSIRDGGELVHYDFYRLDEAGIMKDELSETVGEKNVAVVVEWAKDVEDVLPEDKVLISIKYLEDGSREVTW